MKEKNKMFLIGGILLLVVVLFIVLLFSLNKNKQYEKNYVDFVRTYYILGVTSNNDDASYVNLEIQNNTERETVKVLRDLIEDEIMEGSMYEFTFDYSGPTLNDNIKEIFSKMTLKSVRLTSTERNDTL